MSGHSPWLLMEQRDQARERLVSARRDIDELLGLALRLMAERRTDDLEKTLMTASEREREHVYQVALRQQIAQQKASVSVKDEPAGDRDLVSYLNEQLHRILRERSHTPDGRAAQQSALRELRAQIEQAEADGPSLIRVTR